MSSPLSTPIRASGSGVTATVTPSSGIPRGGVVCLHAMPADTAVYTYTWTLWRLGLDVSHLLDRRDIPDVTVRTSNVTELGCYTAQVTVRPRATASPADQLFPETGEVDFAITPGHLKPGDEVVVRPADGRFTVSLDRGGMAASPDQVLWVIIRNRAKAISFPAYKAFIDSVMCSEHLPDSPARGLDRNLPFPFIDAYNLLKTATELFLAQECGVANIASDEFGKEELDRIGVDRTRILQLRDEYLEQVTRNGGIDSRVLPYLNVIRQKLTEVPLKSPAEVIPNCYGILRSKLTDPCLLELIWSYWHEEGMLVQTMNAISLRFQNKRSRFGPGRDPLAHFEIDPLRPLNNLLWGHIQDEQHTLSVVRRAYEYEHHYGLRLVGRAIPDLRPAESRSKFIEAFHNLLHLSWQFLKESDDVTVVPDAFPVLNSLRDCHLLLAQGAHNQFGDLPSTARMEMLIQQWLISRPEIREFLGGRIMVPYSEPWMDRVDVMKQLQGWNDVTITNFHDLAVTGEQILLGVRYGNWMNLDDQLSAANWARFWRPEIYRYIHAYRAVTGVDLTADMIGGDQQSAKFALPSELIRRRLIRQRSASPY